MENGLSLIMPSYLEAENLKLLLPDINKFLNDLNFKYEIIVVDTISPLDDTQEICLLNNALYIQRENSNTYGDAIRTGIKYAKFSTICIMDSDGSHEYKDLARLYNKIQDGYDICIGSRYIKGGNSCNSFILKFMSYVLNVTYRLLFNLKVKDVSNSYRMYDAEKLKSIKLESENFEIVEEILIKLCRQYKDLKLCEIPVYFNKRKEGSSKRNLVLFIFCYIKIIYTLLKFKRG